MLATRLDQWEEQTLQKGLEKGKVEGKAEGKLEGKMEGKLEGKIEGKLEGLQEGQRLFLTRLLERRFGALPEWVSSRLNTADRDSLEQWGLNFVDAKSLEEVFR